MIDLSIIIVNYNSLDFLKACLDSIPACTRGLDTEVIVVDNASSDGSAAFLKDCMEMPGFQYTINESNNGFSRASNQGVGMATGLYLLFMNPDCRFAQGEMKEMLDFYKIQENTGAAGAKILNPNGKLQLSCRSFPTLARQFYESFFLHRMFKKSRIFGSYFMTWWDHR
ncbi:MAG: glycosyltransferase, partial [Actinobacteria bacterium]|nr:glycosyltransferase [Actinomycetota bacterium]